MKLDKNKMDKEKVITSHVDLRKIVKQIGMHDYYDMYSGMIFMLSLAKEDEDGKLDIPVFACGKLIGFTKIEKVD